MTDFGFIFALLVGYVLLSISHGDTFHSDWGQPGVAAGQALPTGQHVGAGHCSFRNDHINYLWESLNASNAFWTVRPLDESALVYADRSANAHMFVLPQTFTSIRHKPEVLQTFQHADRLAEIGSKDDRNVNVTLRNAFVEDLMNVAETARPRRMAVFEHVHTNNFGLIFDSRDCRFVRNAGCWFMKHTKIYAAGSTAEATHEVVISLTSGASGTWHFPMEGLVALAGVPADILAKAVFHVPAKSAYILSWFRWLNIPDDRVVDSPLIHAHTLYVPEMGRCGETFPTQLQWLRSMAHLPLDLTLSSTADKGSAAQTLLLIQRTGSRLIRNPSEVEQHVRSFASENHLQFVSHHDQHLPSLSEQIARFAQARIIVAPHGAALLFSVFAPSNACIIEFMPLLNPECYARIAYLRHVHYRMYTMDNGAAVPIKDLHEGMQRCLELTQ